ncbi:zinc-ribbon-domain-containing protein [Zopfochytrium polystomum]|nr:zinc-ribbon-domain-containing protein [Zopfochytrium polystomum]
MSAAAKAKKVQELMSSKWTTKHNSQSSRAALASNKLQDRRADFSLVTDEDRQRHYHDAAGTIFGCKHYQRGCKLQAHCCGKWYACRFCHDEISDHNIIRSLTVTMMCMYCLTVQPSGQACINPQCQKLVSKYYCKECKLWDDDPRKNIYHCHDCGICRIGRGLGLDYFHCKKCNVCMAISLQGRHKCIERNLESDCPICGEYMFTSTTTVIFMPCGHCIHYKCHQEYIQTSYQCPTCFKSLANMTEYFKRVDAMLAQHRMPPEYLHHQSFVYCNDCEKKSYAPFHFLYHKCAHCKGYNTKVVQTFDAKIVLAQKGRVAGVAEDGVATAERPAVDAEEISRIMKDPAEISRHLNAPILRREEERCGREKAGGCSASALPDTALDQHSRLTRTDASSSATLAEDPITLSQDLHQPSPVQHESSLPSSYPARHSSFQYSQLGLPTSSSSTPRSASLPSQQQQAHYVHTTAVSRPPSSSSLSADTVPRTVASGVASGAIGVPGGVQLQSSTAPPSLQL